VVVQLVGEVLGRVGCVDEHIRVPAVYRVGFMKFCFH